MDAVEALKRLGGVADTATLVRASSRRKVRTAVSAGEIIRDARGHYALPTAEVARREAARLSGVVSHPSAAARWGWTMKLPPPLPSVTVPRNRNVAPERREGVVLHWAPLSETERREGVTGRVRTVIDCAKVMPFDEALAIADSALRYDEVSSRELVSLAERVPTTGRAQCLRVAREADGRAHNPFESVLRAISLEVPGLRLEPQEVLVFGGKRMQPDLLDRNRRLVVEADSFGFHSDRAALKRDCERYNLLARHERTVLRFTWEHVMYAPEYVAEVLSDVVARRPVLHRRGQKNVQLSPPKAG